MKMTFKDSGDSYLMGMVSLYLATIIGLILVWGYNNAHIYVIGLFLFVLIVIELTRRLKVCVEIDGGIINIYERGYIWKSKREILIKEIRKIDYGPGMKSINLVYADSDKFDCVYGKVENMTKIKIELDKHLCLTKK